MKTQAREDTGLQCYSRLRRLLLYGQLSAGERLKEQDWAERFDSHRSAIREALVLLSHEGLLRRGERGGFFVPIYTADDVLEVVEARLVIELGAIRLIARKGVSERRLVALDQICDQMQQLVEADLLLGFVEADRKFHELLVGLAESSRLNQMFSQSPLPHLLPGHPVTEIAPKTFLRAISDHRHLVELFRSGEFQTALDVLDTHIVSLLKNSPEMKHCADKAGIALPTE